MEFHPTFNHKHNMYVVAYSKGQKHLSTKSFTLKKYGSRRLAYVACLEFAKLHNPYSNNSDKDYY
jgi:hypothetical protein